MTSDITPADDSPMGQSAELEKKNLARLRALSFEKKAPPAEIMLDMRLDLLADFLLGPAIRTAFEAHFTQAVSDMLDKWEPHVRASELTKGVPGVDPSVA